MQSPQSPTTESPRSLLPWAWPTLIVLTGHPPSRDIGTSSPQCCPENPQGRILSRRLNSHGEEHLERKDIKLGLRLWKPLLPGVSIKTAPCTKGTLIARPHPSFHIPGTISAVWLWLCTNLGISHLTVPMKPLRFCLALLLVIHIGKTEASDWFLSQSLICCWFSWCGIRQFPPLGLDPGSFMWLAQLVRPWRVSTCVLFVQSAWDNSAARACSLMGPPA